MLIKRYLLKDPRTDKVDVVFEYPECLASPAIRCSDKFTLVTRELMKIPIFVMPKVYLTQSDGYELDDSMYASFEYQNIYNCAEKELIEETKLNSQLQHLKDTFGVGANHKHTCKTMFFTGPKCVYKIPLTEDWVWTDKGMFELKDRGWFKYIESMSVKGINDIFVTGIFIAGGEQMENTQCKITLSRK